MLVLNITGVLFENRPALYFCNYKENNENNSTRMLDTLLIDNFFVHYGAINIYIIIES